jgi:hypothetical protein
LEQLKSLESSIAIFDSVIARIMEGFNIKLESMTGIGTTLAAVIFSEIGGELKNFLSCRSSSLTQVFIPLRGSRASQNPMDICLNAVRLICDVLFGLPLLSLFSTTLL